MNMVTQTDKGWFVVSEDNKTLGGPYTEEEARRRQVNYLLHRTAFPDADFDTLTAE